MPCVHINCNLSLGSSESSSGDLSSMCKLLFRYSDVSALQIVASIVLEFLLLLILLLRIVVHVTDSLTGTADCVMKDTLIKQVAINKKWLYARLQTEILLATTEQNVPFLTEPSYIIKTYFQFKRAYAPILLIPQASTTKYLLTTFYIILSDTPLLAQGC